MYELFGTLFNMFKTKTLKILFSLEHVEYHLIMEKALIKISFSHEMFIF